MGAGYKTEMWDDYLIISHPIDDIVVAVYDNAVTPTSRLVAGGPITMVKAYELIMEDEKTNHISRAAYQAGYDLGYDRGYKVGKSEGSKNTRISISESIKRVKEVSPTIKLDDPAFLDKVVRGDYGKYKEDGNAVLKEED